MTRKGQIKHKRSERYIREWGHTGPTPPGAPVADAQAPAATSAPELLRIRGTIPEVGLVPCPTRDCVRLDGHEGGCQFAKGASMRMLQILVRAEGVLEDLDVGVVNLVAGAGDFPEGTPRSTVAGALTRLHDEGIIAYTKVGKAPKLPGGADCILAVRVAVPDLAVPDELVPLRRYPTRPGSARPGSPSPGVRFDEETERITPPPAPVDLTRTVKRPGKRSVPAAHRPSKGLIAVLDREILRLTRENETLQGRLRELHDRVLAAEAKADDWKTKLTVLASIMRDMEEPAKTIMKLIESTDARGMPRGC